MTLASDPMFWLYTFEQFFKLAATPVSVVLLFVWWNEARREAKGPLVDFLLAVGFLLVALANRDFGWSYKRFTDLSYVVSQINILALKGGYRSFAMDEGFVALATAVLLLPLWRTKGFRWRTYGLMLASVATAAGILCAVHWRMLETYCASDAASCAGIVFGSDAEDQR